jgi:uncharacterized GH25 family protein
MQYILLRAHITFVTVKVTLNGQPVGNAKIIVYPFLTPAGIDLANLGRPTILGSESTEKFTDNMGKVTFKVSCGNYTVRAEANGKWCAKKSSLSINMQMWTSTFPMLNKHRFFLHHCRDIQP